MKPPAQPERGQAGPVTDSPARPPRPDRMGRNPPSRRRATGPTARQSAVGRPRSPGPAASAHPPRRRRGRRVTQGVPRQPGQAMQRGHDVRALPLGAHLPVRGQTGLQAGEQFLVLAAETEAHRIFDHDQIRISRGLRQRCGRLGSAACGPGSTAGGSEGGNVVWLASDGIHRAGGVRERSALPGSAVRGDAESEPGGRRGLARARETGRSRPSRPAG